MWSVRTTPYFGRHRAAFDQRQQITLHRPRATRPAPPTRRALRHLVDLVETDDAVLLAGAQCLRLEFLPVEQARGPPPAAGGAPPSLASCAWRACAARPVLEHRAQLRPFPPCPAARRCRRRGSRRSPAPPRARPAHLRAIAPAACRVSDSPLGLAGVDRITGLRRRGRSASSRRSSARSADCARTCVLACSRTCVCQAMSARSRTMDHVPADVADFGELGRST